MLRSRETTQTSWSFTVDKALVSAAPCFMEAFTSERRIAYDIKLIMNKDVCDIIRPQWILDSVAKGEKVPLTKK